MVLQAKPVSIEPLLLWSAEQVEQERQRADALAAKLRELGVDPEVLR
jgi:hypothetical protein